MNQTLHPFCQNIKTKQKQLKLVTGREKLKDTKGPKAAAPQEGCADEQITDSGVTASSRLK